MPPDARSASEFDDISSARGHQRRGTGRKSRWICSEASVRVMMGTATQAIGVEREGPDGGSNTEAGGQMGELTELSFDKCLCSSPN
ncbi:MAG: hypothetical protein Q9184_002889 [Pyrenodesmia sp. 2 TL-2023]